MEASLDYITDVSTGAGLDVMYGSRGYVPDIDRLIDRGLLADITTIPESVNMKGCMVFDDITGIGDIRFTCKNTVDLVLTIYDMDSDHQGQFFVNTDMFERFLKSSDIRVCFSSRGVMGDNVILYGHPENIRNFAGRIIGKATTGELMGVNLYLIPIVHDTDTCDLRLDMNGSFIPGDLYICFDCFFETECNLFVGGVEHNPFRCYNIWFDVASLDNYDMKVIRHLRDMRINFRNIQSLASNCTSNLDLSEICESRLYKSCIPNIAFFSARRFRRGMVGKRYELGMGAYIMSLKMDFDNSSAVRTIEFDNTVDSLYYVKGIDFVKGNDVMPTINYIGPKKFDFGYIGRTHLTGLEFNKIAGYDKMPVYKNDC